ncbi:ECF transporter S component [Clostridium ganghwense]|uniref:ECF transporter S component n=1 Tax=Clostridium ganghwense TaxID=312089 RepID=A0ABT4CRS6_9CLOT|nr:ECF transporter S component [Clostridium ganghwense]MCY6371113.1 ECF transporter S component [Clostridium ganghwense]
MENKHKDLRISSTGVNYIIQVGMMAAITYVATAMFHIPSFMGVVHLGDSMIFLAAILLGKKKGAVSSAIGMTLFDILTGYGHWAPFTFVIKGVMGYIAGSIAYRKNYKGENPWNNLFAFCVAGIFMIGAYYLSGVAMARFIMLKTATLNEAFIIAIKDIPGNISQVVAGIVIGLPLSISLKRALKKANISL